MTTTPPLHLAVALDGAGWHPAAWREPGARAAELFTARHWVDQVREAERGRLDFVTIADSLALQSTGAVRGRLDAMMIAARVAPVTRNVGIVPAATTTLTEPFLVSTQVATLDFVSGGRAGWQADVVTGRADVGYVGPRALAPPEERFDEAADHVEVVRRLWDSWEDDAEIRDAATSRFLDRDRVHYVDFEGAHFSVKGPSITPRPPQGQPIVATLASSPAAYAFAARSADVVFVAALGERDLAEHVRHIEDALGAAGRDPAALSIFADVVVFLDDDAAAAPARKARLDALDDGAVDALVFTGTPADLAEQLIAWGELGASGFRLRPGAVPHDLQAITRRLVPELQSRGAFRREYEAPTLRGLLGLARPANRYATA